ncbi:TPA: transferrin-binding protein-like solute binding protein [Neisseria meningitidis]
MRLRSNPQKHRQIKLPPPADTVSPATGADTASPSAGTDGGDSKTEIPPKDTRGEGETAQAGADGGVQNDAPQHNDNAPAAGTSDTQPENNRDMPGSDAGRADGGNQDTDAPKNAESQDGMEGNAVSEGTGMPANPPSENAEHTEVAMNADGENPPAEAEDSDKAGQDGMQADEADGRKDAEEGLQGDDPQAVPPAEDGLKTGSLGEKYFDGKGEITALMIGGETINLTIADEQVSSNHPGLMSDFSKVMVSQKQYTHLIYGAVKLADDTYALFVKGKPTETLPVGNAKYTGNVLHFAGKYKEDWFNHSAYKAAGKFTAEVDFSQKTVTGKIDTKDPSGMGTQNFTAQFDGNNSFKGTWQANEEGKGDISGRFYGEDGAEMAGRYSYKDNNEHKSGFGVFAGKKEVSAR